MLISRLAYTIEVILEILVYGFEHNPSYFQTSSSNVHNIRFCDGKPYVHGNIVGFINSSLGTKIEPNVGWVECHDGLQGLYYFLVIEFGWSMLCVGRDDIVNSPSTSISSDPSMFTSTNIWLHVK